MTSLINENTFYFGVGCIVFGIICLAIGYRIFCIERKEK